VTDDRGSEGGLRALAAEIAAELARVDGIVAVSLGGSVARGAADAVSDVDLGLYYRRARPPDGDALRRVAAGVDDRGTVELTDVGGWGPRINGGGWLLVRRRRVDWLYREVEAVDEALASCGAGRSDPIHQPGHPWGWQPQIYCGEVAYGIAVSDPDEELARLRAAAFPYPEPLRDAKRAALWEADFALDVADKPARRGDVPVVVAALSRASAAITDAVFAMHRAYLLNEKQAAEMRRFGPRFEALWSRISAVLAAPGRAAADLVESVGVARRLVKAVRDDDGWGEKGVVTPG
jgi:hypothetical protein